MRIRFTKDFKFYHAGRSYDISYLTAISYIKRGIAIKDKMLDWGETK